MLTSRCGEKSTGRVTCRWTLNVVTAFGPLPRRSYTGPTRLNAETSGSEK